MVGVVGVVRMVRMVRMGRMRVRIWQGWLLEGIERRKLLGTLRTLGAPVQVSVCSRLEVLGLALILGGILVWQLV